MNEFSSEKKGEAPNTSPKPLNAFIQMKKDSRWKVFGQSALVTLTSIFVFGGIGWLIDEWMVGGGHAFFITFLILSYPVTQFALYKKMKNFNFTKK